MGLLRFLLAIAVVVSHLQLSRAYAVSGGDAVKVFFMISGFYMAMILREKYGRGLNGVIPFWKNRFLRLYPLYVVVLAASISWHLFCTWMTHGGTPVPSVIRIAHELPWWQCTWVWVTNLGLVGTDLPSLFHWSKNEGLRFLAALPADDVNGVVWMGYTVWVRQAWSIGAEIWFYALAPLLAFASRRALAGFGFATALITLGFHYYLPGPAYFFWPALLSYFVLGIGLFRLHAYLELEWHLPQSETMRGLIGASSVLWLVVLPWAGLPLPPLLLYATAAVSIPILFAVTKQNELDRRIGNLSYGIYLNHLLVTSIVAVAIKRLQLPPMGLVPLVILGSCCFALITERLVERPIERIRARIATARVQSALCAAPVAELELPARPVRTAPHENQNGRL